MTRSTASLFFLTLGCTRAAAPPPANPTAVAVTAPAHDASAALEDASAPAPAVASVPEADARALVDAWLRAQNGGDFAAYERLYAPRFTGIRRSGPRERRFDRAGWVADRQGMFRAAMQVTARDVSVDPAAGVAMVRFTQDFTQGTYHDVGRKEIVLVRGAGGLQIAREEMLDSTLSAPAGGEATPPPPGHFLPVYSVGDVRFVILGQAEAAWGEGEAELLSPGEVVVARKAARAEALPEGLRGMAGQAIRLVSGVGSDCGARIGAMSVLSRIDVHFGTSQRWAGEDVDGSRITPLTPAQIAAEVWGSGGPVLVARLEDAARCTIEPLWARLATVPPAPLFAQVDAPAPIVTAALARFRALPAWRAAEAAYREDGAAARGRPWDQHEGNGPQVTLWQAPSGGRRFVTVSAAAAVGGCGAFSASMTSVFELTGARALVLLSDGDTPSSVVPEGAADLDGDGLPEFVAPEGLFRRQGGQYRLQTLYSVPNRDCPC